MIDIGYLMCEYDNCVYHKNDLMALMCKYSSKINKVKAQLSGELEMKYLSPPKKILGMYII